jgi:hypothetical protein
LELRDLSIERAILEVIFTLISANSPNQAAAGIRWQVMKNRVRQRGVVPKPTAKKSGENYFLIDSLLEI